MFVLVSETVRVSTLHAIMSEDASVQSYLSSHVLVQKKPITYRLLSRERNLHVSAARDALDKFREGKNAEAVKAVFVLQGRVEGSGENKITLVGQDKLEGECRVDLSVHVKGVGSSFEAGRPLLHTDVKATFARDSLSVQVYSISPASESSSKGLTASDVAFFSTVPLTLASDKTYTTAWEQADRGKDFGVIDNERVKKGDPRAVQAAQEQASAQAKAQEQKLKEAQSAKKAEGSASASTSTSKAGKPAVKKEESPETSAAAAAAPAAKSNGLNWNKAK